MKAVTASVALALVVSGAPAAPAPSQAILPRAIRRATAFRAGEGGIHSFRIPALVTAADGTLLLFAEARKQSWVDKSPTDIVLKRSRDGGRTWSPMARLLPGGGDAYMDPLPVVDRGTARIFLFACRWPADDHSTAGNTAWMMTSEDHGLTWSEPRELTRELVGRGRTIRGFGPGHGIQMGPDGRFANRLVIPIRTSNRRGEDAILAAFSDNGGRTWRPGGAVPNGSGEFMIAEGAPGRLVLNRRDSEARYRAFSVDGGQTWTRQQIDPALATVVNGCQGCLFAAGGALFFTTPAGIPLAEGFDNRANLTLYRSFNGGHTWPARYNLSSKAAGYSDLARLDDGRLALVFETADTRGFIRRKDRPAGWMRLDVMILPAEIASPDRWFGPNSPPGA